MFLSRSPAHVPTVLTLFVRNVAEPSALAYRCTTLMLQFDEIVAEHAECATLRANQPAYLLQDKNCAKTATSETIACRLLLAKTSR
ncbi:hypothetical protein EJ03DRAFT_327498 [Teratosphaeria nubilosa]|uniref:Uncharacterized protein n=1 Tax=Teratosphaeria nubilosa TaxID=161662 RepID=A0A6G1L8Q7_9PEZI|nr:hypothetical protein EJ03DRAFT_327498 [Teratosphaeria nubilosa]